MRRLQRVNISVMDDFTLIDIYDISFNLLEKIECMEREFNKDLLPVCLTSR